jgi:flavorubredoxin
MHDPVPVSEGIYWVGVNDFETQIFEAIWPLPRGVSYNSYVIIDDKIAVLDTVKSSFMDAYFQKLAKVIPEGRKIDYLIVNHMEPDHSGAIKVLMQLNPEMKIIGNKKTCEFLKNFYRIEDCAVAMADGDTLSLGKRTLQFHLTPMVHWPETMVTYEPSSKILFSMDAFGGFGTLSGGIFDDEVDLEIFENETLRYYSNIVGKFSPMVQKAFQKLEGLDIGIIAPTHGPVYRSNPGYIIKKYDEWSRYEAEKGVVVVYASMYGNTEKMAEAVARSLAENGIDTVIVHNVSRTHLSYLLTDTWRYKGLVIGSCTYNVKLFPLMDLFVRSLDDKMMQTRVAGLFGSFSWSGGALKDLKAYAEKGKWQLQEPDIEAKSCPTEDDLDNCALLGKNVAGKVLEHFGE